MQRIAPLRFALFAAAAAAAVLVALALASSASSGARAASSGSPTAGPSRKPVPILMYHAIRTAPAGARNRALWVRPREFAAQVRALRRAGYRAVTMQRVWDSWQGRAALPPKPIVLSFDDGYASQVRIALPVLRRVRWAGVLNLTLSEVGKLGGDAAVRRLIDAGWEIGAHTRTHPDLTVVSDIQLRDEVVTARREMQDRFEVPANFFCYPAGRYDGRVVAAVAEAGYLAATTVRSGFAKPSSKPYALARVQVSGGLGATRLLRRLRTLRSRAGSG